MVGNYNTAVLERTLLRWSIIAILSISVAVYVACATTLLHRTVDYSLQFGAAVAAWVARPALFTVFFIALLTSVGGTLYLGTRL
jgi:hypothetical protein